MNLPRQAVVASALALTLAAPMQASARPGSRTLSKTRAWMVARQAARSMYLEVPHLTDYAVEPASDCARRSVRTVDCQYELYDDATADGTTITCTGIIRVRLSRFGRTSWDDLYDVACS